MSHTVTILSKQTLRCEVDVICACFAVIAPFASKFKYKPVDTDFNAIVKSPRKATSNSSPGPKKRILSRNVSDT